MFGIGTAELLILLLILLFTVVPGVLGIGVLIWLVTRKKRSAGADGRELADSCAACGAKVAARTENCPHCGSPMFQNDTETEN
jgi:hypothetical protein